MNHTMSSMIITANKHQESLYNKLQLHIYHNLQLLNLMYPPSSDFQSVFKNRMFAKNNKAGFHQVMQYLLKLLYPENIEDILPSWPIVEIRMELQFRNDVYKAITELSNKYSNADIPPVMPSHFVSPGGPRIIKLIFKLTHLAMKVCIKRNSGLLENVILEKPQKVDGKVCVGLDSTEQQKNCIASLTKVNNVMEHNCADIKDQFEEQMRRYQDKEKELLADEKRLKTSITRLRSKLKELQSCEYSTKLEDVNTVLEGLQAKIEESNSTRQLFDEGCKFLKYLIGEASCLKYSPESFYIPTEFEHIIPKGVQSLNLNDLMTVFNKYLHRKRFDLKEVSSGEVTEALKKFQPLLSDLKDVSDRLDELGNQFQNMTFKVENNVSSANKSSIKIVVQNFDSPKSPLAVPLEDTF